MLNRHLFEPLSEVCIACGISRLEADKAAKNECDSIVEYREWFLPHAASWLLQPRRMRFT